MFMSHLIHKMGVIWSFYLKELNED